MHRHDDSPAVGMAELAMAAPLRDQLKTGPVQPTYDIVAR